MTRNRKHNNCPRCGGNLFLEQDEYDQYLCCLQCGFHVGLDNINEIKYHATEGKWETLPSPI